MIQQDIALRTIITPLVLVAVTLAVVALAVVTTIVVVTTHRMTPDRRATGGVIAGRVVLQIPGRVMIN